MMMMNTRLYCAERVCVFYAINKFIIYKREREAFYFYIFFSENLYT